MIDQRTLAYWYEIPVKMHRAASRLALRLAPGLIVIAALGATAACTPGAEDLAYPDLGTPPTVASPASLLTPAERDEAISELNAEAAANAELIR